MSISDLYFLHGRGYIVSMDGDKKSFTVNHEEKNIKIFWGIKKEPKL